MFSVNDLHGLAEILRDPNIASESESVRIPSLFHFHPTSYMDGPTTFVQHTLTKREQLCLATQYRIFDIDQL